MSDPIMDGLAKRAARAELALGLCICIGCFAFGVSTGIIIGWLLHV